MTPLEARQELGLSIEEMARALGIHRQTWVKWERCEQRPPAVAVTAMRMLVFISIRGMLADWRGIIGPEDCADPTSPPSSSHPDA